MSIDLGTLPPHVLEKYAKEQSGKVLTMQEVCRLARKNFIKYQKINANRRKKGLPPINIDTEY